MIAKAFHKLNYTSVIVSSLLLVGVSYYYSNLDLSGRHLSQTFKWNYNFCINAHNYAIDTVTRQLTIERTNRNAYHFIISIIVFSFLRLDMRFILLQQQHGLHGGTQDYF